MTSLGDRSEMVWPEEFDCFDFPDAAELDHQFRKAHPLLIGGWSDAEWAAIRAAQEEALPPELCQRPGPVRYDWTDTVEDV